ncbi:hypothetical protein CRUP_010550 [Coryphaenoides rupestris]|nr:hypothetical protein CRUP_010550 [Coryphaenoides rupestris]
MWAIGARILAGCTTGAMAVAVAQPTDVVKVRFQAQVRLPGGGGAQALQQHLRGVPDHRRGTRASGGSGKAGDNMPCHFTAAFAAGFCTTVLASPVDVIKTRYMNSAQGQYSGAMNCAVTMFMKEGAKAFYKGYVPTGPNEYTKLR